MRIYKRKIYPVDNQRMRFEPFKGPKGYVAIRKIKQKSKDAIFRINKKDDYKKILERKYINREKLVCVEETLDDIILKNQLTPTITEALSLLTPREERIIRARFGIGVEAQTLEEIGCDLSVTRDRISQIVFEVLRKLRHNHYGLKKVYKQLVS
jgi:RNA polymerase sigma factor (sigma-70 family)